MFWAVWRALAFTSKNPNFVFRDSPAGKFDKNPTKIFYFCSGHQKDPEWAELGGTCGLQFWATATQGRKAQEGLGREREGWLGNMGLQYVRKESFVQ